MFSIMFKSDNFFFLGGGGCGGGGGESTTFALFAFRYAVLALAQWAGAPSCSNCIPLWFLNNGMTSVSSTSC